MAGKWVWRGVERPEAVQAFLAEYDALCTKHGMKVSKWETHDDAGFWIEELEPSERAVEAEGGKRALGFDATRVWKFVRADGS